MYDEVANVILWATPQENMLLPDAKNKDTTGMDLNGRPVARGD